MFRSMNLFVVSLLPNLEKYPLNMEGKEVQMYHFISLNVGLEGLFNFQVL